ncbi:hypothetical protein PR202_gb02047 [Eleusine coracana subsp. coracana]|uniref:Uncharacterized protein n=1 Tax=Eleusine coracana subsp. coracana TaxID=191504 RepID=A0AAV5DYB4_ELECO|nr:hypothetical protein PR202_gb02047 [Eleusine coracana subsp. coracana]
MTGDGDGQMAIKWAVLRAASDVNGDSGAFFSFIRKGNKRRHGPRAVLRQDEREAGAVVAGGGREAAQLRPAARHRRQLDRPAAESRWSIIASKLPGRTDNDVKNYWNTKLKKKTMAAFAVAPGTPLSPASSSVTSTSSGGGSGDGFFAAFTQPQGLIRFDAPPCRSPTELASVPPATTAMDGAGGVWASAPAGDAMAMDDVFLSELVGGGDTLFSYGDFFGGLQPQDRAFELSACYFPNMAEMWGAAAAGDHAHAKPQGLCNTLM